MASEEHLIVLKQGVKSWNAWREEHPEIIPDLSGAELSGGHYMDDTPDNIRGINLEEANLSRSKLRDAFFCDAKARYVNLCETDLCGATFYSSDLIGANFQGASLGGTDLDLSYLTGANFSGAHLWHTLFTRASLDGANFERARLEGTVFGDNDLSSTINLETIRHDGPSVLGLNTIYASKGRLPGAFLRGCGLPESFIIQMPSLVGAEDGIQFYSCFISYSTKDEQFARRLYGRMRDANLRVWFAPEDIEGGKKLDEQIETAIRVYDKLLIVLSEASLKSEWVMTELRKARKAERRTNKRKLFPVRLVDYEMLRDWECFDADGGKDLAVELREYFIPDFSCWKDHDSFEAAFTRLLKDLKA